MKINQLIDTTLDINIDNIMLDSRHHKDNALFICVEGLTVDGHQFIEQAKENGAIVAIGTKDITNASIPYLKVKDINTTLNQILRTFYDNPSSKMTVYGVTGTNGKTTIANTIYNILNMMNVDNGYIGTLGLKYKHHNINGKLTTPDPLTLMETLHMLNREDIKYVSIEASSQGIDMHRLDGVDFDYIGFTNLSMDHLDYHKTMENYFMAKAQIFNTIPENHALINIDDDYGKRLKEMYPKAITYGQNELADYKISDIELQTTGSTFNLFHKGITYYIKTNMVALYNVYNLVCAIGLLCENGFEIERIINYLEQLENIEGRLTPIENKQGYQVFIDYGHSPESMNQVLKFLKDTIKDGKLITVFGSAGARDTLKRPIMGEIADKYCDIIILTEDDSRWEDPVNIMEEIASGITNNDCIQIEDRYEAIKFAIKISNTNDIMVIFGKGKEEFLYFEDGKKEWLGDHNAVIKAIKEKNNEL